MLAWMRQRSTFAILTTIFLEFISMLPASRPELGIISRAIGFAALRMRLNIKSSPMEISNFPTNSRKKDGQFPTPADDRIRFCCAWIRQAQPRSENFATIFASIGVPMPHMMAWVTSLFEFAGGISVMLEHSSSRSVSFGRSHVNGSVQRSSAIWFFFDPAKSSDSGRCAVWADRI